VAATELAILSAEAGQLLDWSLEAASVLVGLAAGFGVVWALTRHTRRVAHEQAAELIEVARREAAVAGEELRQKAEAEIQEKRAELNREYDRREIESDIRLREIKAHEESLALLDYQLEQRQERLNRENAALRQARDAIRSLSKSVRQRLEGVSQLDADAVRRQLREEVLLECQDEFRALRRATLEKSERELQDDARRVLISAMQRIAGRPNNDLTATIIQLPSEEMKGRIIGREGRNIKSFESATGVTLLIDESPQMVLVSSFDPVRREVARVALEGLVKDGRIHPASIEEYVRRAQEEIDLVTTQAGEEAVARLRINGLNPEIIRLLGRLKFRFSYTQNVLDHSVETAFLASLLASEVGLDPDVAKRAGLLHDIGKAAPGELEGSHATIYAGLVILADTLSANRPGARADSLDGYIQRIARLERLATAIEGVQQAFAVQAGRELRVVVAPTEVTDDRAREIARDLRKRIETELQYPSTIKVTVIRESRFTETAT
jgi:ribonuclease Y